MKVRVAIVGASGYSGEELLRLLLRHPGVEVTCVTSRQYAGQPIGAVFPRFMESRLTFSAPDSGRIAQEADVAFLALPHGLAHEFALPLLRSGLRVIDISADFRLRDARVYEATYKVPHPAPELLEEAVYGLPEWERSRLPAARLVACPGCYPTSVLLPALPVLAAGLASRTGIAVASLSGVSGAGRKVDLPYIFPECNESLRPYAVTGHRHVPEIEQQLALACGVPEVKITFVPHLVPVNRGIHSTILMDAAPGAGLDALEACLHAAYDAEPFVRVLPWGGLADTKHVVFTNMCEIGCAWDGRTGRIILSSAIDNLTKGASGQAVQCLNIAFGIEETTGLL
ncbi:MAG: N-acetyl-gamma-glutamyl-phosphate reductase [Lentisphaeria bacterium]|nr:N-acetyl-gamma-glutamyl-phosphate reductase [Lentisphaeria bacterium]